MPVPHKRALDDDLAIALVDPSGRIALWTPGAHALTGHPPSEIIGRDLSVLADRPAAHGSELVARLVGAGGGVRTDWLRCGDGTCRSVRWRALPLPLAAGTRVPGTEALGTEALGTGMLAVAGPGEQRIQRCDPAAADLLLHSSPIGLAVLDNDLRYRFINDALARLNGLPVTAHLGRSILDVLDLPDPQAYEDMLRRVTDGGETIDNLHVAAIRPDGTAYAAVGTLFPLRDADGRIVGQAGVVHDLGGTRAELLDTARSQRRLELLSRISAALSQGLDVASVATKLSAACAPAFARTVTVDLLASAVPRSPDAPPHSLAEQVEQAEQADAIGSDAPAAPRVHRLSASTDSAPAQPERDLPRPLAASIPVSECILSAETVASRVRVLGEGDADEAREPPHHALAVPLLAAGQVLGAITFCRPGGFDPDDVLTARDIAARTAMALDNALLYRRERLATLALQRHLLPARLPDLPWARSAHRYLPAENGTLAGGDWYDCVRLPGGRVGLTVGDVMGHGLGAAAAMGRYRSSARALLAVGLEPGQLLTRLDGLDDGTDNDLPATCACVVYDAVTGDLRLALAGHPPPLLIHPNGSADILAADPGPPVGMGLDHVYEHAHHLVPPGSLLVLYTDGMIEDRSTFLDLEQGIGLLRRAVHRTETSLDEVCDALLTARPTNSADDATLFVTRLTRIQPVTVAE
ncbi:MULTISPECIES: SpoIIE family protein phosphatase [unclassified Streptomyces]|uniref:SpoIIE family protein phosphatase n=1 Tax=unclassified Streptomyces TaxID=2593676 RepID=UPI002365FC2D|nr:MULTISPECIES: SpoIIE family protein phosphatase [unclassified Streptomyces]MDF3142274.1 SpoIIE family protein phosphatase [Streptomyces sp. T21Q-yed]WDF37853.1 SpoIIE family protein phosphatase [Streptomyces sp. T12]